MAWITSWSYAQRGTFFTAWQQKSFTYTISNNLYGSAIRLKFSNWYGTGICRVRAVKAVIDGMEIAFSVEGKKEFSVLNDKDCYSDKVLFAVKPGEIKVIMEFPEGIKPESGNTFRPGVAMILQSLEVLCDGDIKVIALFGDSITHWGNWANPLIHRLYQNQTGRLAMFEMAINGSRLLNNSPKDQRDGLGYDAITRFQHDILNVVGITHCFFALGLNDLSLAEEAGDVPLTYDNYVACVNRIIAQAHLSGIQMIGLTICPRKFDEIYTGKKNELRKKINNWIMHEASFDSCVDVAALVTNEFDTALAKCYDCGDGVHINEIAGEKIAMEIEKQFFKRKEKW